MSRRVIGYEGEGRHRRPVYALEEPARARRWGPIVGMSNRGLAGVGGELVEGVSEREQKRAHDRAYKAQRRGQA